MRDSKPLPFKGRVESDPTFLNRLAWVSRWRDRRASVRAAETVLGVVGCDEDDRKARHARGQAFRTLAWQAKWRGDFDTAMQFCLKAEGEIREHECPVTRADVYAILGVLHYSRSRLDLASGAVTRGLGLIENMMPEDCAETLVDLLVTQATVQRYKGEKARAGISLSKATEVAPGPERSRVEQNTARFLTADGDPAVALKHAERSLELAEESHNRVVLPYAHEVIGASLVALKRPNEARPHFEAGLALAREDEDTRVVCQIAREEGHMERQLGHTDAALDAYRRGYDLAQRIGYPLWGKTFCLALADIYEEMGELKRALECHKQAWRLVRDERH